ncbi:MAG TPA: hypothetical protein DDW49_01150 [Deltaproteobacteria bacterium]|nr:MAG: hypothetical protein A2048_08405 [Deltaproteobacteria bacterium GWA2_45_12]HBF11989.1 hypothetical protein [Deltaproteobacteria bacterium]
MGGVIFFMKFPKFLEQLILTHIKTNYGAKGFKGPWTDKDLKYFIRGAAELSYAFTQDKRSIPKNYLNHPVYRSGYLLYFLPANILKISSILEQLPIDQWPDKTVRILDVGSGPGTSMLGFMAFQENMCTDRSRPVPTFEFTLIDQSASILNEAKIFHDAYASYLKAKNPAYQSTCRTYAGDLRSARTGRFLPREKFHFIVMSNFLNECGERNQKVEAVLPLAENYLDENGFLLLVEPALRKTSRDLQYIRDELVVNRKLFHVYAPCLHDEICPLNQINHRDWCHFYFSWDCPEFIEKADRLLGHKKEWLKASYLLLGRKPRLKKPHMHDWRVISNRIISRGKKELVLCGPKGRYHARLLDKNVTSGNKNFDFVRRGDLIHLKVPSKAGFDIDGFFDLTKEDKIEKA